MTFALVSEFPVSTLVAAPHVTRLRSCASIEAEADSAAAATAAAITKARDSAAALKLEKDKRREHRLVIVHANNLYVDTYVICYIFYILELRYSNCQNFEFEYIILKINPNRASCNSIKQIFV